MDPQLSLVRGAHGFVDNGRLCMLAEQLEALNLGGLHCPVEDGASLGITGHQIGPTPENVTIEKTLKCFLVVNTDIEKPNLN